MHTKIMIIGSPGSGKSTFARKLRDKAGLPLFYLDMIKHKQDRTTISSEEFDKKLKEILVLHYPEHIPQFHYDNICQTNLLQDY